MSPKIDLSSNCLSAEDNVGGICLRESTIEGMSRSPILACTIIFNSSLFWYTLLTSEIGMLCTVSKASFIESLFLFSSKSLKSLPHVLTPWRLSRVTQVDAILLRVTLFSSHQDPCEIKRTYYSHNIRDGPFDI